MVFVDGVGTHGTEADAPDVVPDVANVTLDLKSKMTEVFHLIDDKIEITSVPHFIVKLNMLVRH